MTAQAGICAEPNLYAHYLMLNILPAGFSRVPDALAQIPALWQSLEQTYPDAVSPA